MTFLAVLRNQCDWVSSSYLQRIKRHRLTQDSDEAIRRVYLEAKYLKYNSYFAALSPLVNGRIGLMFMIPGFDDVPQAAVAALTTVRQSLVEKGREAGRLLMEQNTEREVVLPLELVVRGSTAPPP